MTNASAARAYYRRRRRLSLATGDKKLFRRSVNPYTDDKISMADYFPFTEGAVLAPVTFQFVAQIASEESCGLALELGDQTQGMAIWFIEHQIGFAAGGTRLQVPTGFQLWVSSNYQHVPANVPLYVTASILPTTGDIRLWLNGHLVINARSSWGKLGHPFTPIWANDKPVSDTDGSYFGAPQTVFYPVPSAARVAPTSGLVHLSDLSIYTFQRPRHFNTGPQDDKILEAFEWDP